MSPKSKLIFLTISLSMSILAFFSRSESLGRPNNSALPVLVNSTNLTMNSSCSGIGGMLCIISFFLGWSMPMSFAVRHQDGRPQWQADSSRHLRPADEARHHHEPKQVHLGSFGVRKIVLHQPPLEAVLGTEHPYCLSGHGKQLSGFV